MAGTFTQLLYHFVFSTKNRVPVIATTFRAELHAYMGGIIKENHGVLLEAGGMPDHVHLLARLHQDTAPSEVMRLVKANSSKWINEERKLPERFEWQGGYGAFTVSKSAEIEVAKYIRNQEEHHRKLTFQDEFLLFLKKHGIEYDPTYSWE